MSDDEIERALRDCKTIAIVGMSPKEERPSWGVARFLKSQGYRIVPVNPGHAGETMLDETVYGDLASIPDSIRIDMVDIFRRSDAVPEIVDEALANLPGLSIVWMQLGVEHAQAANKARKAGLTVIENRCPKIEIPRLGIRPKAA
ncbi:CoA-binding protein [Paracoccus sp. DMF-8]|uniref:CoA-binding protein n=1 Tax=Paracoccus sp. DMF-8 TaxID=3019445 RepID=UPI0023E88A4D|nr:CoA-binding protein [Paracoccus sp. DMF-8]MDF3605884.1 CoA-binding protein [Paracoccus sp. DMF-8]